MGRDKHKSRRLGDPCKANKSEGVEQTKTADISDPLQGVRVGIEGAQLGLDRRGLPPTFTVASPRSRVRGEATVKAGGMAEVFTMEGCGLRNCVERFGHRTTKNPAKNAVDYHSTRKRAIRLCRIA
jgi:hypothetical protein